MIIDSDFRKGDSITIEVSNKPYVDRTIPPSANDYRNADSATIKVYDPCGELFIDCPMFNCADRVGWYLFRIQTDDEYQIGLYKVEIYLESEVPEAYGVCTTETTGSSGEQSTYLAKNVAIKYFRLMEREVY